MNETFCYTSSLDIYTCRLRSLTRDSGVVDFSALSHFESSPIPTDDPTLLPTLFPNSKEDGELTRIDEQGAVVFEVTPLNLGTPTDTLEFDVAMNTHSDDLSMDLAALSTLSTDTGLSVQASKWDAVPGGHHVQGTLIFPSSQDGKSIFEGSSTLTLTIVNVDAPSRVFEWKLN